MIRLCVMDDGPFGILVQESPDSRQQTGTAVFTAFAKDLRVMQDDPASDLVCMSLEFIRQLVSRVTGINEQQIAGLNVDRQRIALHE